MTETKIKSGTTEYNQTYYSKNKERLSLKRKQRYAEVSGKAEKEQKRFQRLRNTLETIDEQYIEDLASILEIRKLKKN